MIRPEVLRCWGHPECAGAYRITSDGAQVCARKCLDNHVIWDIKPRLDTCQPCTLTAVCFPPNPLFLFLARTELSLEQPRLTFDGKKLSGISTYQ